MTWYSTVRRNFPFIPMYWFLCVVLWICVSLQAVICHCHFEPLIVPTCGQWEPVFFWQIPGTLSTQLCGITRSSQPLSRLLPVPQNLPFLSGALVFCAGEFLEVKIWRLGVSVVLGYHCVLAPVDRARKYIHVCINTHWNVLYFYFCIVFSWRYVVKIPCSFFHVWIEVGNRWEVAACHT